MWIHEPEEVEDAGFARLHSGRPVAALVRALPLPAATFDTVLSPRAREEQAGTS